MHGWFPVCVGPLTTPARGTITFQHSRSCSHSVLFSQHNSNHRTCKRIRTRENPVGFLAALHRKAVIGHGIPERHSLPPRLTKIPNFQNKTQTFSVNKRWMMIIKFNQRNSLHQTHVNQVRQLYDSLIDSDVISIWIEFVFRFLINPGGKKESVMASQDEAEQRRSYNVVLESKPSRRRFDFGDIPHTLCIGHELERHNRRECSCFQLDSTRPTDCPQLIEDNLVIRTLN